MCIHIYIYTYTWERLSQEARGFDPKHALAAVFTDGNNPFNYFNTYHREVWHDYVPGDEPMKLTETEYAPTIISDANKEAFMRKIGHLKGVTASRKKNADQPTEMDDECKALAAKARPPPPRRSSCAARGRHAGRHAGRSLRVLIPGMCSLLLTLPQR